MSHDRTVLSVATSPLADADVVLDLGSQHPTTHGALRLGLTLDGDRIIDAAVVVGYMHRGAEKLFEVRDYRQIIVLANRHDWLAAFANELGVVIAVERMLGIEVPERAVWARTLLGELGRVLSHLMFLGGFPLGPDEGGPALLTAALREREAVQRLMEEVSGGRMHYMLNRVGGLKEDLPNGWEGRARAVVAGLRGRLPTLVNSLLANDSFGSRTRGIGVLAPEHVLAYGVSGPIARASGVAMDLRLDEPYLAYDRVGGALRMVTRPDGDAYARFDVLAEQTSVSLDIADACLDALAALAPGPVNVKLPKVVRAPEGATYAWTENPLGLNGYYLVSRGEKTPWRLKLRSASFNNVQVLPHVLRGLRVDQVAAVVASMFAITGDIDK